MHNLRNNFGENKNFISKNLKLKKEAFGVKHFAGTVFYSVENFIDKNRNSINQQLFKDFSTSGNKVLSEIFLKQVEQIGDQKK